MKSIDGQVFSPRYWSPSVWREWIEMISEEECDSNISSPSVWREWIEMDNYEDYADTEMSPSVWREWIEISCG